MKKRFLKIAALTLVMAMLFTVSAFAANSYYLDVELSGPDRYGTVRKISAQSGKNGTLDTPLSSELAALAEKKFSELARLFLVKDLGVIAREGLTAFASSNEDWDSFVNKNIGGVSGDAIDVLKNKDSKFGDLEVGKVNELTYTSASGTYTLKLTLNEVKEGYADVEDSAWYAEGVRFVTDRGVMNGIDASVFAPNVITTRAMIVTILYRLEGAPEVAGENPFTDVAAGAYYDKPVNWASSNGIVNGYGNGKFGPTDTITREQMAAILYRYAVYKGCDVSAAGDLSAFGDAARISEYAVPAMTWAVGAGLINGVSDGTLAPGGDTTRAQAAVILMRYIKNVIG